ncbi:MAG TPA: Na-translocating system protein MpsC family protein [Thermoleophilaceae bacterium]|jgi:uncharacterized protein YbcI
MSDGTSSESKVEVALARELLKIHEDSYGRGATDARVYVHDDLIVCMLDELELLPNEEFLIGAGQGEAVTEIRGRYQQAIETTFRAAVERSTGRRVVSFASITKLAPNYVVEIFRLGNSRE